MENDFGGSIDARGQIDFLHNQYFPRLAWADLALINAKKWYHSEPLFTTTGRENEKLLDIWKKINPMLRVV
jgi:hypothetical protein